MLIVLVDPSPTIQRAMIELIVPGERSLPLALM
jgi:hypothetical protein